MKGKSNNQGMLARIAAGKSGESRNIVAQSASKGSKAGKFECAYKSGAVPGNSARIRIIDVVSEGTSMQVPQVRVACQYVDKAKDGTTSHKISERWRNLPIANKDLKKLKDVTDMNGRPMPDWGRDAIRVIAYVYEMVGKKGEVTEINDIMWLELEKSLINDLNNLMVGNEKKKFAFEDSPHYDMRIKVVDSNDSNIPHAYKLVPDDEDDDGEKRDNYGKTWQEAIQLNCKAIKRKYSEEAFDDRYAEVFDEMTTHGLDLASFLSSMGYSQTAIEDFKEGSPLVVSTVDEAYDEDEEEAPKKKKSSRKAVEEDEEEEAPKKKSRKVVEEEEDEEEEETPKRKRKVVEEEEDEEEEEEEETPKRKSSRKVVEEDDEEEEEETPKRKRKPLADDDDEEEEEPPKKKRKVVEEDDEEEEEPPKRKRKVVEEEDEEEEEPPKKKRKVVEEDDEEEEEPPKKRKVVEEDDDEEEDDTPRRRRR